ncbi:MAG: CapA family protein, partial [Lachnospiraceae bacterium]|nr:CapA family protein [Lachnospiraceae bacterium]
GYTSTMDALRSVGVVISNSSTLGIYEVKGIKIGMLAYQTFNGGYDRIYETLQNDIDNARTLGCDIVTVSYHWGAELDYHPNDNQQRLGKATIDAGADLVIGHHSHRINPIEEYNGKYIVYSLGNFSFAGNNKPSDMLTYVFQIRFKYRRGEMYGTDFRIIPCRISSKTDYNDFAVTPLSETRYIDTVLTTLKKEGAFISNPVTNYPLEWEK